MAELDKLWARRATRSRTTNGWPTFTTKPAPSPNWAVWVGPPTATARLRWCIGTMRQSGERSSLGDASAKPKTVEFFEGTKPIGGSRSPRGASRAHCQRGKNQTVIHTQPMNRPLSLLAVLLLAPSGHAPRRRCAPSRSKPNFVIIFIDDLGYADIGPFGATKQKTPNLDRMAARGHEAHQLLRRPGLLGVAGAAA